MSDKAFALPEFITFTGVDEHTDPGALVALANQYPIEWGILFSPSRQGLPDQLRYPRLDFIEDLVSTGLQNARLAAHVCGAAARSIMSDARTDLDELIAAYFMRAQINTNEPQIEAIAKWAKSVSVYPIVQCRGEFPPDHRVSFLFDASGGRGISPASWPAGPDGECGYAGGINPDNASQVVATVGHLATRYWIDMESGVRDDQDRFSIERCRSVCESIYGDLARQKGLRP